MSRARAHTLSTLAEVLGASVHGPDGDALIEHLSIDSRKPFPEESTLFIALRGERHDAHGYIPALLERGVRFFLVEELPANYNASDRRGTFLVVRDTRDALQRLAGWHRAHYQVPVVGITGSNGKTVVKEWLFQLLRGSEHIVRSPGSWNSQVGVPLSVWEMNAAHTLGLFEAGISKPGEMERLRAVIKPGIGIFTNIGPAHGENFHSDLEKALEKVKLFHDADTLVYCADHGVVHQALHQSGLAQRVELRGWSREREAWLHVVHERTTAHGTHITVINDAASFAFDIPFTDPASVENALHCVTLLLHLGHSPAWIAERTPHLAPVAMRLEVVDGVQGMTLINDAYSNDAASLAIALEHMAQVAAGRPQAVVLSDILESGDAPDMLYQRVAELLERAGVRTLFAIGPQLAAQQKRFSCTVHAFADPAQLLHSVDPATLAGHVVLVKGARTFALEQVVQRWQRQVHGTVLEVDLEAIRHNLNYFRALLPTGVRTMAMVKAFGYGTGALELARLFAHEQVHYLGVAYADEGIELRQQGITLPILVMNPEPVPFETLHRFGLEAEVYDERSLREAVEHARLHPGAAPVHIKLDTGMHRLGFTETDLPTLLQLLGEAKGLRVASILSHLAGSEAPEHDTFTRQQLALFGRMADAIDAVLGYTPLRHIANSAASCRFPEARLDMVRIGIGLHGVGHNAAETARLLPAVALHSPIAQLRSVRPGESVGYGRRWVAPEERIIATLPIGYADGLSRRLGNGVGRLWLHGHPAPIVGSVCMDMVMIDVTGIRCALGDPAYLFNAEHPITELAQDLGTIPYEVLTSVPPRVKRVYVRG
ncbi:MAG: bifunctional UDP-N-acetylmuramoyl-tripeptide:D-alanyl-D-alanine ligase/alanine racemase [Flavobacteriales bacterium]